MLSIETLPQLAGEASPDVPKLRRMVENIRNGSRRDIVLDGVRQDPPAVRWIDSTPYIDRGIREHLRADWRARSGLQGLRDRRAGVRHRASKDWNARCGHRQQTFVPRGIIVPFIDRLIAIGVLPEPGDGYSVSLGARALDGLARRHAAGRPGVSGPRAWRPSSRRAGRRP